MSKHCDWIRTLRIAGVALPFALGVALHAPVATAQDAGLESVKPTSSADAYYERGARALRQGRNDDAVKHLAQAARLQPEDPAILSAYAQALIGAGRQDEAVAILKQARGTRSVNEDLALGVVAYELKQYDDAARHLGSAVQRDPSNGASHYFYASALTELGRYDEAWKELDAAIERDEWLAAEVASKRGQIELARGNKTSAEKWFREAERLAPNTLLGDMARRTAGTPDPRPWSIYATVGVAFDSNVNLGGDDPRFSSDEEADYRFFLELGGDWDIIRGDKFNLRVGGNWFMSRHGDQRDFDIQNGRAFAIAAYAFDEKVTADLRYTFEYTMTDWNSFRRVNAVEPSIRWRPRQDLLTRFLVKFEDRTFFPSSGVFPARFLPPPFDASPRRLDPLDRDGYLLVPGMEQYYFTPNWTGWGRGFIRGGFRWREERTDGQDNDSTGPVINLLIGQPLPWSVYLIAEAQYDRRNYAQVSSVGLLTEAQFDRRQDDIWSSRVALRRPITDRLTGELSYRYMHWGSNVDFYQFERHIVDFLVTYRY